MTILHDRHYGDLFTAADLSEGRRRRDEALDRVLQNAGSKWKTRATAAVKLMRSQYPDGEVTGEDVRFYVTVAVGEPHHCNAWGGFISSLVKSNILRATGKRVPMRDPRSHARKTDVYRLMV